MSSIEIPLADRATAALMQAGHAVLDRRIVEHVIRSGHPDIRPAHARVFEHLVHRDGLRAVDIASMAGMSPQSVMELVDDLERLGYVERRQDPADRRAKHIFLTRKGRKAVAASGEVVRQIEKELRAALGADYLRLRRALLAIIESEG